MRLKLALFMAVSLAGAALLLPGASAQEDPAPNVPNWYETHYVLELGESLETISLDGTVAIREAAPPDGSRELQHLCGSSCSAEELRDAYDRADQEGRDELVAALERRIEAATRPALDAVAGSPGASAVTATVDRASLEVESTTPYEPPVTADVVGSAPVGLLDTDGYDQDQIDVLFQMGAAASVPIDQTVEPGTNLTLVLVLPEPLEVLDGGEASLSDQRHRATWIVDNSQASQPATLSDAIKVGDLDVVVPNEEDVDIDVVLDLSGVDIHYGNLLGAGAPASLDLDMSIQGTFSAIETPETALGSIELPYLSADAVRLALEHDLLERSVIDGFEQEARNAMRQALTESFGMEVPIRGGFLNETLEAGTQLGSPLGTGGPVEFSMNAAGALPFPPPEADRGGVTAFEITRVGVGDISLPAISVPGGAPVTYTVIFPPGIDIDFTGVSGGELERSTSADGRTQISFASQQEGEGATIQGAEVVIEHPFVWHTFWPLILALLLVLVVLPVGLIYWLGGRRRDRTPAGSHETTPGVATHSPALGEDGAGSHGTDGDGDGGRGETSIEQPPTPQARSSGSAVTSSGDGD